MDHGKKYNEQQCYCYNEELTALAHSEIFLYLHIVFFLHHLNFPGACCFSRYYTGMIAVFQKFQRPQ